MNVRHTVIYTFTVSAMELKEIINALKDSPHPDAQNLAEELRAQTEKSRKEIQRRFSAQHNVLYKAEGEE